MSNVFQKPTKSPQPVRSTLETGQIYPRIKIGLNSPSRSRSDPTGNWLNPQFGNVNKQQKLWENKEQQKVEKIKKQSLRRRPKILPQRCVVFVSRCFGYSSCLTCFDIIPHTNQTTRGCVCVGVPFETCRTPTNHWDILAVLFWWGLLSYVLGEGVTIHAQALLRYTLPYFAEHFYLRGLSLD